jgi:DNA-binding NarL/FixJ family response regulator
VIELNNVLTQFIEHSLEEYISELKSSLKTLSQSDKSDSQKEKLKELYNELNLVSNTLLNSGNFQKMEAINQEFLLYIKNMFPDLTESEQEVCYFLYLGMKNKEIATNMNTTIRAIESSRYRISKKMNLATKGVSVKEYIQNNLKEQELE